MSLQPSRAGAAPSLLGTVKPTRTVWRRHVALVDKTPAAPCPAASDPRWKAEPLFRSGETATLLGPKGVLPAPLERFCVYAWADNAGPIAGPAFAPADKVVRVDPDREVVIPQGAYLGADPTIRATLNDAFLRAMGARPAGAAGPSVHNGIEGPARVAVIDTLGFAEAALTYTGAAGHQRHGVAMAEVVGALRCPNDEAGCRGQQFHAQAFPYTSASPFPTASGGPLGSLGSLAHALGEAVVRRQKSDMRTSPLVLNLSLGWDPRYGGELTSAGQEAAHTDLLVTPSAAVEATVQAVHTAMVYATCLEALPIAAAGNNPGAACEQQGLVAPASWERYPAPDRSRCEALFGTLPAWRPGDPAVAVGSRSLVYGAGGIDPDGRAIPIARPGGTPPRVLPAFQAVVGAGGRQTEPLTGTSIAAAALSALAVQVWSHHRVLGPHQVIALLDASGQPTAQTVDLGMQKSRATRLWAHGVFEHMCALRYAGATCPNPYEPPTAPAQTQDATPVTLPVAMPRALACTAETVRCGRGDVVRTRCDVQAATSPQLAPGAEPWLRPQPDTPLCPACPIRRGKLKLSLNPDYTGGAVTLVDPVLEFRRPNGGYLASRLVQVTVSSAGAEVDLTRYTVDLGAGPVTLASVLTTEAITSGTLAFNVADAAGGTAALVSAIAVYP
ncbi:hypothetical protein [Nannocystis punicea]|uniref:Peptidase S8/S53 domain-containing protein n=1 Tax=Nannocystis punicea TaxID=2995304 RepID=A0ABY7GRM8_9BACT|nr:hypothetical protein [Nannocystis poenicansa]WAS89598.1 hypothetical protein O0S08_25670 [Nannocystis poenicansa]